MPYRNLDDLPERVRENLPEHAQEIWRAAYNSASDEYKDEETPFKVAWAAVERDYEKGDDGRWHRKRD